jgi:hypothetical protein
MPSSNVAPLAGVLELVALPYDYRPMAELAIRNGRRDWESILCRGYVATAPEPAA